MSGVSFKEQSKYVKLLLRITHVNNICLIVLPGVTFVHKRKHVFSSLPVAPLVDRFADIARSKSPGYRERAVTDC